MLIAKLDEDAKKAPSETKDRDAHEELKALVESIENILLDAHDALKAYKE